MAGIALDRDIDYFDTRIKLTNVNSLSQITVGTGVMIGSNGRTAEICRVDGFDVINNEVLVARGCMDTIPRQHVRGTPLWFFDGYTGSDYREYGPQESVAVKVLPRTSSKQLKVNDSPIVGVQMDYRFARPYAPGHVTANGQPWWFGVSVKAPEDAGLTIAWKHRDRVLQADRLIDHFEGDIGPEPGTTYSLEFFIGQPGGMPFNVVEGITGNSFFRSMEEWQQILSGVTEESFLLVFTLTAHRDGYPSWMSYNGHVAMDLSLLQAKQLARIVATTVRVIDGELEPPENPPKDPSLSAQFFAYEWPYQDALMTGRVGQTGVLGLAAYRDQLPSNAFQIAAGPVVTEPHGGDWPWTPMARVYGYPLQFEPDPDTGKPRIVGSAIGHLTTTLAIGGAIDKAGAFAPGTLMVLTDSTDARTAEIVQIEHFDLEAQSLRVRRGCLDTIPREWQSATAWLYRTPTTPHDDQRYAAGAELLVHPVARDLPALRPAAHLVTMDQRQQRPYAPGNLKANGVPWFNGMQVTVSTPGVLTFAYRDRLTQGMRVVDHFATDCNMERGSSYYVQIWNGATPLRLITGIRTETWTYDIASANADARAIALAETKEGETPDYSAPRRVMLEVGAEIEGLISWQPYFVPVTIHPDDKVGASPLDMPHLLYELPYVEMVRLGLTPSGPQMGWLGVAAGRQGEVTRYLVAQRSEENSTTMGVHDVVAKGSISAAPVYGTRLGPDRKPVRYTIYPPIGHGDTEVYLKDLTVEAGDALMVARSGEIMQVVNFDAEIGMAQVLRGCADTIPTPTGQSDVYRYRDQIGSDGFVQHTRGDTLQYAVIPRPDGVNVGPGNGIYESFTYRYRQTRPYAPGFVRANGRPWYEGYTLPVGSNEELLVTWVARNRVTQGTTLVGHQHDDIPAEPGTTYRVRVIAGSTILRTVSGITVQYFRYTAEMMRFDARRVITLRYEEAMQRWEASGRKYDQPELNYNAAASVTILLDSVRDEAESWSVYSIPVRMAGGSGGGGGGPGGSGDDGQGNPGPGTNPNPTIPPDPSNPNWPPNNPNNPNQPPLTPDPGNPYNPDPSGPQVPDEDNPNSPQNPTPGEKEPGGWGLNWSRGWNEGVPYTE